FQMVSRAQRELISDEVEVTLVYRFPPSASQDADRFVARVHVVAGTIRLKPIDSSKRGMKMTSDVFVAPPTAPSIEEGEGEETLMATLEIKDQLMTSIYKAVHFNLGDRSDNFEEMAEKFRTLLLFAWCDPRKDPHTPRSQPLPTKETSPNESRSASFSLKRSATSPSSEASDYASKISRVVSNSVGGEERGASSEESEFKCDLKGVEDYRKLARFFEEIASSVYRMDEKKRARIVRIVSDLVELAN
ncbi:hypothetical protein PMAYCL1PPCAC_13023, partial [Pristionchus mayeri]